MWAKCPCDIFRKYVVNSNTNVCKKTRQNEEKTLKHLLMVLNSLNTHHSEIHCK